MSKRAKMKVRRGKENSRVNERTRIKKKRERKIRIIDQIIKRKGKSRVIDEKWRVKANRWKRLKVEERIRKESSGEVKTEF